MTVTQQEKVLLCRIIYEYRLGIPLLQPNEVVGLNYSVDYPIR